MYRQTYRFGAGDFHNVENLPTFEVLKKLSDTPLKKFKYKVREQELRLFKNDEYELSTVAQLANLILMNDRLYGDKVNPIYISDAQAFSFFKRINNKQLLCPFKLTNLSNTLTYAMNYGFPYGQLLTHRSIPHWGSIDIKNQILICNTLRYIGPVYAAINLYEIDHAYISNKFLNATINKSSIIWGSNTIIIWGYCGLGPTDKLTISIWDRLYIVTWLWLLDRITEAYGVSFPNQNKLLLTTFGLNWLKVIEQEIRYFSILSNV